jgi:hypothetical protein
VVEVVIISGGLMPFLSDRGCTIEDVVSFLSQNGYSDHATCGVLEEFVERKERDVMDIFGVSGDYFEMRDFIKAHPDMLIITKEWSAMYVSSVGGFAVFFGDLTGVNPELILKVIELEKKRFAAPFN